MNNFTYDELRMIKIALTTEIMRREENPLLNPQRLAKYEDLLDKVYDLLKKTNNTEE